MTESREHQRDRHSNSASTTPRSRYLSHDVAFPSNERQNSLKLCEIKLSELYLSAIELRKRKRKEVASIDARDSLTLCNVKRPAAVGIGRNSAVGSKRARK